MAPAGKLPSVRPRQNGDGSDFRAAKGDALLLGVGLGGASVAAIFVQRFVLLLVRPRGQGDFGLALVYFLATAAQAVPMIGLPVFLWRRRAARLKHDVVRPIVPDWRRPLLLAGGLLLSALVGTGLVLGAQSGIVAALSVLGVLAGLGFPLLVAGIFFRGLARPGGEIEPLWLFLSALIVAAGALGALTLG